MKNNISSKKIVSIIITILLVLSTRVYAANDSFETTLKAEHSQVKRGENVTITIGLDNISIESGDKGIGSYTANIKFDSSVLEYVSAAGTDKWEKPSYQEGLILGVTEDGEVVKNTQNIASITFKVKDNAKLGKTSIELENFSGSTGAKTGNGDVSADNRSIEITVVNNNSGNNAGNNGGNSSGNNTGNNNSGNSSNGGSNNSSNNSNKNSSTYTKDNTAASGKLPQTGERSIALIVCIGLTMVCSIIFYIKMKRK